MSLKYLVAPIAVLALAPAGVSGRAADRGQAAVRFSDPADIDNRYLPLTRFDRCELRGREDGARVRVVRRLLDRTREFSHAGRRFRAAVIEDRAIENGALVERTLDYFAQGDGGTVYYLGEHVDNYRNGRVVNHNGTWLYGKHTDTMGVGMPARPRVGSRWRHEDVPGVTTESDRVVAILPKVTVRGKVYRDVLKVRERIEPEDETEFKLYAPRVGNISERPPDGRVELVGCERKETR
jgi:hypothetical protein